jgi:hypothetical protein
VDYHTINQVEVVIEYIALPAALVILVGKQNIMPIFASLGAGSSRAVGGIGIASRTVPGAPTIGTATSTGQTTATVAFTAPASNGGATITQYIATSSPGNITGTLNQAGSGTITVSGLTAGTSYTFTVKAVNSVGQSLASSASNQITTQASAPTSVEYLVVAGGGTGGADFGGGGGAGGLLTSTYTVTAGTPYSITVGGGGSNSVFGSGGVIYTTGSSGSITAYRGGDGGSYPNGGNPGGSGGGQSGGQSQPASPGGVDYPAQGNSGGSRSTASAPGAGNEYAAGGGGGAGGVGGTGVSSSGGAGGAGLAPGIAGPGIYYAAGGGGGGNPPVGINGGSGGSGIGGYGVSGNRGAGVPAPAANNGSGGGGASGGAAYGGGNGSSGVVILAYPTAFTTLSSISPGLAYDTPSGRPGYRVYRFTGGSGPISW